MPLYCRGFVTAQGWILRDHLLKCWQRAAALSVLSSHISEAGSRSLGLPWCLRSGMGPGLTISLEALMGIPGECEAALWKSFHHYSKLHWPGEAAQLKWLSKSAVMPSSDRQEAGNATLGWHFCLPPAAPQPGPGSGSWREKRAGKRQETEETKEREKERTQMQRNLGAGLFSCLSHCQVIPFNAPSNTTHWEEAYMENSSPLTARLPTADFWCFYLKRHHVKQKFCNVFCLQSCVIILTAWQFLTCYSGSQTPSLVYWSSSQWI